MFEVFGSILLLMLSGTLWDRFPHVPSRPAVRVALSAVVLNLFLPALTFQTLYSSPITQDLWLIPAIAVSSCLASALLAFGAYKILSAVLGHSPSPAETGALVLVAAWGNVGYLGIPIISAYFGDSLRLIPILFLLALTPFLLLGGSLIGMAYSSEEGRKSQNFWSILRQAFRAILIMPPIWGAVLGFLFNIAQIPVHPLFLKSCTIAGSAVSPMMIFSVGLALRFALDKRLWWILPAIAVKLVISPVFGWLLSQFFGLSDTTLTATVMECGMPTMILTIIIADRFALDSELAAQVIAISTIVSFMTIPLIAQILS